MQPRSTNFWPLIKNITFLIMRYVVAGDIDIPAAKKMINDYFAAIPRGADVPRVNIKEAPITSPIKAVAYDPNIQIPAVVTGYRMPSVTTRDAKVLT